MTKFCACKNRKPIVQATVPTPSTLPGTAELPTLSHASSVLPSSDPCTGKITIGHPNLIRLVLLG